MLGPRYLTRRLIWRFRFGSKRQGFRRLEQWMGTERAKSSAGQVVLAVLTAVAYAAMLLVQLVWVLFWVAVLVLVIFIGVSLA